MRENTIRTKFENGEAVVNGWLAIPSSIAAEGMAHSGFDSLTIDLQHGPIHFDSAVPMLQAISTTDVMPMARVPWNEPGIIMKMLDAGCYAIICPMINTKEECEAFVGACRYPDRGYRSHGPTRVSMYAGSDYPTKANDSILTFAMIETAQALENLDEILSVPELDAIYIGPADLSRSMTGVPAADHEEGPVADAIDHILKTAKAKGIYAGIHCTKASHAKKMIEQGFQFVTIFSDLGLMRAKAKEVTSIARGTAATEEGSSPY